jgi:hypothetical protein
MGAQVLSTSGKWSLGFQSALLRTLHNFWCLGTLNMIETFARGLHEMYGIGDRFNDTSTPPSTFTVTISPTSWVHIQKVDTISSADALVIFVSNKPPGAMIDNAHDTQYFSTNSNLRFKRNSCLEYLSRKKLLHGTECVLRYIPACQSSENALVMALSIFWVLRANHPCLGVSARGGTGSSLSPSGICGPIRV